jgi:hypothetical protein
MEEKRGEGERGGGLRRGPEGERGGEGREATGEDCRRGRKGDKRRNRWEWRGRECSSVDGK